MDQRQTFFALLSIFAIVQVLGLYCGYQYIGLVNSGEMPRAVENPENAANSMFLFMYILLTTGVIILIIRYKKSLLKAVEAFAIFFASMYVFYFVTFNEPLSIALALMLTGWKMLRPTILSQNIAIIMAVSGAGAILGGSLGVFPVIVFLLLLSIYDFISVFITKHMVYMAKAITETPMAFTAAVPMKTKKFSHVFQLGGGDLVMPLILSVSVLGNIGLYQAVATAAGAFIALSVLFYYVLKHPGQMLPALPPICAGACLGYAAGILLLGA